MAKRAKPPETIAVGKRLIARLEGVIAAALAYEKATHGKRKLGITGEVGELWACHQLGLRMVLDSGAKGYDAVDKDGKRVQTKTRRSNSEGLPSDAGRIGRFSRHKFDYALLVLLDRQYRPCEIWRADYETLKPLIRKARRRAPHLADFKKVAERIYHRPD